MSQILFCSLPQNTDVVPILTACLLKGGLNFTLQHLNWDGPHKTLTWAKEHDEMEVWLDTITVFFLSILH